MPLSKASRLSHSGMLNVFLIDLLKCAFAYSSTSTVTILTKYSPASVSSSLATFKGAIALRSEGVGTSSLSSLAEYK